MNLARAAYHERSLGQGLDDYYSEWGERPGVWWGGGANLLGSGGNPFYPFMSMEQAMGVPALLGVLIRVSTGVGMLPRKVYEGDDQLGADDVARELWLGQGIPASRIVELGEDNFWKAGPTGPCGPCSELYYDRGAKHGCGGDDCKPGCDCDRFLEFWNLVFMEFDRDGDGALTPLPAQNIDTGSGLERVAMLLQDAGSIYETDQTTHVIAALERLSGRITAADMRAMNYAADVEHRDVPVIVRDFLARTR